MDFVCILLGIQKVSARMGVIEERTGVDRGGGFTKNVRTFFMGEFCLQTVSV